MTFEAQEQQNKNAEVVAQGLPDNCHVRHCFLQEDREKLLFQCDCGRQVPECELERNAGVCDQCTKYGEAK